MNSILDYAICFGCGVAAAMTALAILGDRQPAYILLAGAAAIVFCWNFLKGRLP